MHGVFKPFQVNFHVLPFKNLQNTSRFVTLFSSWGRSGWICYLPYCFILKRKEKRKKRKEKKAFLHGM
jgi:hypothetical protein